MDLNEFKRAFFDVACDMQKLLHDLVAPACQRNGLTLQQMHVLVGAGERAGPNVHPA